MKRTECWYKETCTNDCNTCIVFTEMNWQMQNSGLPEAKQRPIQLYITDSNGGDKNAFNRLAEIRKDIVDFVQTGGNLYICSKWTGNGKTSWAIKMLHTYFHHTARGSYENLRGMFVSTTDLLLNLKDFNNPLPKSYLENLRTVDLVVWDDIAISGMSNFDFNQLYSIIDYRLLAEKSNIFTSNQPDLEELTKIMGSRLASRIYHTSEIVELKGKDMR